MKEIIGETREMNRPEKYHYLKQGKLYGLQIKYLIKSEYYGWIGVLSFSSPAWRVAARDKCIGWNEENRLKNLNRIVCNSRFLIIPQIKVNPSFALFTKNSQKNGGDGLKTPVKSRGQF